MKITKTEIKDVYVITPEVFNDDRGYFFESYRDKVIEEIFPDIHFCQENESKSTFGVIRGLHYQMPPYAQTKLVRVIQGAVLDIVLDVRKGSPTFGKYIEVELNENNKAQLLVPRGFAHGFVVLSKEAIFSYKVDNYYNKQSERGIAFDDKFLGIDWRVKAEDLKISEKDKNNPSFYNADYFD